MPQYCTVQALLVKYPMSLIKTSLNGPLSSYNVLKIRFYHGQAAAPLYTIFTTNIALSKCSLNAL